MVRRKLVLEGKMLSATGDGAIASSERDDEAKLVTGLCDLAVYTAQCYLDSINFVPTVGPLPFDRKVYAGLTGVRIEYGNAQVVFTSVSPPGWHGTQHYAPPAARFEYRREEWSCTRFSISLAKESSTAQEIKGDTLIEQTICVEEFPGFALGACFAE